MLDLNFLIQAVDLKFLELPIPATMIIIMTDWKILTLRHLGFIITEKLFPSLQTHCPELLHHITVSWTVKSDNVL
jgi:hypothetical protein